MRKKSGFSVVELLVILAILSIIVVLTLRVGESVTASSRITGLINNFLADFSQAKLMAATENRYVAVTFSGDGRSYTLQKQANISNFLAWTHVKTVTPLSDQPFCTAGEVANFAVNSTGEVRLLKVDGTPDMATALGTIPQVFHILRRDGSVAYRRTIQIFPYGGLKVEKN